MSSRFNADVRSETTKKNKNNAFSTKVARIHIAILLYGIVARRCPPSARVARKKFGTSSNLLNTIGGIVAFESSLFRLWTSAILHAINFLLSHRINLFPSRSVIVRDS